MKKYKNLDLKLVTIYADGACEPNPGIGGWACILMYEHHKKVLSGSEDESTNNRMELTSVIEAFKALKYPCKVEVFVDSKYVKNGITEWIKNWKLNGWKTSNNKDIKNQDLWKQLDEFSSIHEVTWNWVPGHAGVQFNEECDRVSVEEIHKTQKYIDRVKEFSF